jgi:hypothetical protein
VCCPVVHWGWALAQRSAGTATAAVDTRTVPESVVVLVPALAVARSAAAAAAAAAAVPEPVELALPVGSWQQPATTAPKQPSWLADQAVPVRLAAGHTVLGLHRML